MKTLTKAQTSKIGSFVTTSAKIRYLDHLGVSRGDSSRYLKIKYQFVRGVLEATVKTPKETW